MEWISVNDRLPDDGREYLVYIPKVDDIDTGFIWTNGWFTKYGYSAKVEYWMEIPPIEEWTNLSNSTPAELGWYMTYHKDGEGLPVFWKLLWTGREFIVWDNTAAWDVMDRGITHWMPLPELPEEDD